MSELVPFTFPNTSGEVRVVMIDDEPWWVAADVCREIGIVDARQAMERLEPDEYQQVTPNRYSTNVDVKLPPQRPAYVVNESGLYSLILWSTKPEAKEFKRWITREVIPQIRKTGSYQRPGMTNIDMLVETALEMQRIERQQLALAQRQHVAEERLIDHAQRLRLTEARLDSIEHIPDHMTILAYHKADGRSITSGHAAVLGRQAAGEYRKRFGQEPPQVRDERYGLVNLYPIELLNDLFT